MEDMTEFLTPKDISNLLKISYTKSLDFIKYSGIVYLKLGNQYRVRKDVFDNFTDSKYNLIVKYE